MRKIFVDTGYWIAIVNRRDSLHNKALAFNRQFDSVCLVTSEMVLNEFLNRFSSEGQVMRRSSAKMVLQLYCDPGVEIVPQTPKLFSIALELYRNRLDQNWSHTDCASFCIMNEQGIREALAHDRHFEQAGFIALLRQSES